MLAKRLPDITTDMIWLQEAVYSLAYDPVRGVMASASKDKTIKLWEPTVYALDANPLYSKRTMLRQA